MGVVRGADKKRKGRNKLLSISPTKGNNIAKENPIGRVPLPQKSDIIKTSNPKKITEKPTIPRVRPLMPKEKPTMEPSKGKKIPTSIPTKPPKKPTKKPSKTKKTKRPIK